MKTFIKLVFQKLLGFKNYLFVFSLFINWTLKRNRNEGDFLHFLSLLSDNSTILDVGANIGVMSVHMARRFPASDILAFEPVPDNYNNISRLKRFFRLTNIHIVEIALGNHVGVADIIMPVRNNVKFQGLSHIEGAEGTSGNVGKKYSVKLDALDNVQKSLRLQKPISGIKIDVENYEYQVLEGAKETLLQYKPIVYAELWNNQNRKLSMDLLTNLGYKAFVLNNNELVQFNQEVHNTQNFFFIHSK